MPQEARDWSGSAGSLRAKLAIIFAALILFAVTLQVSVVRALSDKHPKVGLQLAPYDSQALSSAAAAAILADQKPDTRARARDLAIRAIERDPTSVAALRTLALVRELDGQPAAALRLMEQSEAYSRRDLLTQLWLIEHSSRSGDVPQTLRHYDTAMRSSDHARQLLIPTLVAASTDRELQAPIRSVIAKKPLWWQAYANRLISEGGIDSAATLTNGLLDPRVPEERALAQNLISRAASHNRFDIAWSAFSAAKRRADPRWTPLPLRNGSFENSEALPVFDWLFAEDPELNATRILRPTPEGGYALQLVAAGRSGDVAFQLLHVPAGAYVLGFTAGGLEGARVIPPEVSLICAVGARSPLATARVTPGRSAIVRAQQPFTVPAGCDFQWLTVRANVAAEGQEGQLWIDDVTIRGAK